MATFRAKKQPGGGDQAGEKGREGAERRKKLRLEVWHGKQEIQVARPRVSRTGKISGFTNPASRALGTVQSSLSMSGCGCSLQFAKASAATLSQQEKNDTADVQRGRVNISGFNGTVVS
jgi:hypothetical protein